MTGNLAPVLELVKGQPRASSLVISEHFGKRHDNVLRLVRSIQESAPAEFNALNFEDVEIVEENAIGGQVSSRHILMTRDGFTLVVMGFTGKKALEWKLKYIEAFNRMEEELRMQASQPEPMALSSVADRRPLVNLVNVWCKAANIPQPVAYTQVAGHFGLDRVTQLPASWIQDAVAFVQARIDAAQASALPASEPKALPPARSSSTAREYAATYKGLPSDASRWKDLKSRLFQASNAYGRELAAIRELAREPFRMSRKSDIATLFDNVLDPIDTLFQAAESSEHAVFCHVNAALSGYMAAHDFLTRG